MGGEFITTTQTVLDDSQNRYDHFPRGKISFFLKINCIIHIIIIVHILVRYIYILITCILLSLYSNFSDI